MGDVQRVQRMVADRAYERAPQGVARFRMEVACQRRANCSRSPCELTQQSKLQRLRIWRAVQIAVAGASLVVLLCRLAFPFWPWHDLLRLTLFASLFWMLPLWVTLRSHQSIQLALDRSIHLYFLLAAAIVTAYITRPSTATGMAVGGVVSYLPLLSIAIPFFTWPILRYMRRAAPIQNERLGLATQRWASNLAIGALAGCALGLHLLLAARFVPNLVRPTEPNGLWLFWTFCCQAGLMALGQELMLRGLAFDALTDGRAFAGAGARIVLLNLVIYLTWIALVPGVDLLGAAWLLLYSIVLAILITLLRYRQQSLLPGLATSVVFSLFFVSLLGP